MPKARVAIAITLFNVVPWAAQGAMCSNRSALPQAPSAGDVNAAGTYASSRQLLLLDQTSL